MGAGAAMVVIGIVGIWTGVRMNRLFGQLEAVEKRHATGADPATLLTELDDLETSSAQSHPTILVLAEDQWLPMLQIQGLLVPGFLL